MGVERRKDFWKQENKSIASKLYIALIPQLVCNSEGLQTVRLLCNNPWDQIHIEGLWRRRYATKIRPGSIPVYTSKWSVMIKALTKTLFKKSYFLFAQVLFPSECFLSQTLCLPLYQYYSTGYNRVTSTLHHCKAQKPVPRVKRCTLYFQCLFLIIQTGNIYLIDHILYKIILQSGWYLNLSIHHKYWLLA